MVHREDIDFVLNIISKARQDWIYEMGPNLTVSERLLIIDYDSFLVDSVERNIKDIYDR